MSADASKPEQFHDEYPERFLAMFERRWTGEEITVPPPLSERRGKAVDIFAALHFTEL
jgi:non-homologous end joining protein Ku